MISNFEIDNIDIDFIYARLKKTVSHLDILRWLENFEPKDVNYAIDIASNLTVYTTYEIESILDDSFKSLFTDNDRLIVGPVGKFGKSGCMITYFFQKTDFYNKNKNKILLSQLENIDVKKDLDKNLNYKLVLLDDFIGSGKSIKEYLCNGNVKNILNYFTKELHLIAIAGMKHGIDGLKDDVKFIKI